MIKTERERDNGKRVCVTLGERAKDKALGVRK